jgi:hypothetical protein
MMAFMIIIPSPKVIMIIGPKNNLRSGFKKRFKAVNATATMR